MVLPKRIQEYQNAVGPDMRKELTCLPEEALSFVEYIAAMIRAIADGSVTIPAPPHELTEGDTDPRSSRFYAWTRPAWEATEAF